MFPEAFGIALAFVFFDTSSFFKSLLYFYASW